MICNFASACDSVYGDILFVRAHEMVRSMQLKLVANMENIANMYPRPLKSHVL